MGAKVLQIIDFTTPVQVYAINRLVSGIMGTGQTTRMSFKLMPGTVCLTR